MLASIGIVLQAASTIGLWPDLDVIHRAVVVMSVVVTFVASYIVRGTASLWLLAVFSWVFVAANALPGDSPPWFFINSAALFGAFTFGLLVSPRWSLVLAVVLPITLHLSWSARPDAVIATGYTAWGGWIPPIQVAGMVLIMNVVWQRLHRFAAATDAAHRRQLEEMQRSLRERERAAAQRRAAIAVHESLLNSIRSVLTATTIDRAGLAARLGAGLPRSDERRNDTTSETLLAAIKSSAEVPVRIESTVRPDVRLEPEVFEAVRAAAVELVRNDRQHGDGSVGVVTASLAGSDLVISCRGTAALPAPLDSGLGMRRVVFDGLEHVGASVTTSGDLVRIRASHVGDQEVRPSGDYTPARREDSVFSRSRVIMAAALAAMTFTGLLYFVAAVLTVPVTAPLAVTFVVLALGAPASLIAPLRSRRITTGVALLLVAVPTSVPWLMLQEPSLPCGPDGPTLLSALNLTGPMIILIAVWSREWILLPGLGLWALGIVLLMESPANPCGAGLLPVLANSFIVVPTTAAGTLIAANFYAAAARQRDELAVRVLADRIAAEAQDQMNARLETLVDDVTAQLRAIAEGATLDADRERMLRMLEGRVRAAVQVDPDSSGSFSLAASRLVEVMGAEGVPVDVRALEGSADRRTLPAGVEQLLTALASSGAASIATFTDGSADYLTLAVPAANLPGGTLPAEGVLAGDVEVMVDDAPPRRGGEPVRIIVVQRPVITEAQGARARSGGFGGGHDAARAGSIV